MGLPGILGSSERVVQEALIKRTEDGVHVSGYELDNWNPTLASQTGLTARKASHQKKRYKESWKEGVEYAKMFWIRRGVHGPRFAMCDAIDKGLQFVTTVCDGGRRYTAEAESG